MDDTIMKHEDDPVPEGQEQPSNGVQETPPKEMKPV